MEKEMSLKVSAKHLASVFVALAKAKYSSGKTWNYFYTSNSIYLFFLNNL